MFIWWLIWGTEGSVLGQPRAVECGLEELPSINGKAHGTEDTRCVLPTNTTGPFYVSSGQCPSFSSATECTSVPQS